MGEICIYELFSQDSCNPDKKQDSFPCVIKCTLKVIIIVCPTVLPKPRKITATTTLKNLLKPSLLYWL